MFGFLINRWVLGGIGAAILLGFLFLKGYSAGKDSIQKKWDAEKVVLEREVQVQKDRARETERKWQAKVDKIQKEHIHENRLVNSRYNSLIDSLRDRPEARDDRVPEGSDVVVGGTGAGLARPDAEFLAGYAADAARLQSAYDSCKAAYEVIQNAEKDSF